MDRYIWAKYEAATLDPTPTFLEHYFNVHVSEPMAPGIGLPYIYIRCLPHDALVPRNARSIYLLHTPHPHTYIHAVCFETVFPRGAESTHPPHVRDESALTIDIGHRSLAVHRSDHACMHAWGAC